MAVPRPIRVFGRASEADKGQRAERRRDGESQRRAGRVRERILRFREGKTIDHYTAHLSLPPPIDL